MKSLFWFFLVLMSGCGMKNPYYHLHISAQPYLDVFDSNIKAEKYEVAGKNKIDKNTFQYPMPDSLGGDIWQGDCVVLVDVNNKEVADLEVIGMTLNNSVSKEVRGFDKYGTANKRVSKKIPESLLSYISFIEAKIKLLDFSEIESRGKSTHVYVKLFFK